MPCTFALFESLKCRNVDCVAPIETAVSSYNGSMKFRYFSLKIVLALTVVWPLNVWAGETFKSIGNAVKRCYLAITGSAHGEAHSKDGAKPQNKNALIRGESEAWSLEADDSKSRRIADDADLDWHDNNRFAGFIPARPEGAEVGPVGEPLTVTTSEPNGAPGSLKLSAFPVRVDGPRHPLGDRNARQFDEKAETLLVFPMDNADSEVQARNVYDQLNKFASMEKEFESNGAIKEHRGYTETYKARSHPDYSERTVWTSGGGGGNPAVGSVMSRAQALAYFGEEKIKQMDPDGSKQSFFVFGMSHPWQVKNLLASSYKRADQKPGDVTVVLGNEGKAKSLARLKQLEGAAHTIDLPSGKRRGDFICKDPQCNTMGVTIAVNGPVDGANVFRDVARAYFKQRGQESNYAWEHIRIEHDQNGRPTFFIRADSGEHRIFEGKLLVDENGSYSLAILTTEKGRPEELLNAMAGKSPVQRTPDTAPNRIAKLKEKDAKIEAMSLLIRGVTKNAGLDKTELSVGGYSTVVDATKATLSRTPQYADRDTILLMNRVMDLEPGDRIAYVREALKKANSSSDIKRTAEGLVAQAERSNLEVLRKMARPDHQNPAQVSYDGTYNVPISSIVMPRESDWNQRQRELPRGYSSRRYPTQESESGGAVNKPIIARVKRYKHGVSGDAAEFTISGTVAAYAGFNSTGLLVKREDGTFTIVPSGKFEIPGDSEHWYYVDQHIAY